MLSIFLYLETWEVLQPLNEAHLFCLHFGYIDLINHALEVFTNQWNNHPVTTETNFSPQQLWAHGMITLCNSHHTAVHTALEGSPDYSNYGVDEEGPVPEHEDAGRGITVPESPIVLNDDQLQQLQDAIAEVGDGSDNGIIQYLVSILLIHLCRWKNNSYRPSVYPMLTNSSNSRIPLLK